MIRNDIQTSSADSTAREDELTVPVITYPFFAMTTHPVREHMILAEVTWFIVLPLIYRHTYICANVQRTPIPLHIYKRAYKHTSLNTLPYLTLPYLTLPYHTLPYLTLPYLTIPYLTLPYLTWGVRDLLLDTWHPPKINRVLTSLITQGLPFS